MINLRGTTDSLTVVTTAAVTIDVLASWVDLVDAATSASPNRTATAIATATTTTIVAVAGSSTTTRNVKTINIRNKHATTSQTVTVNQDISGTPYELFKVTLLSGETLTYVEGIGWRVYDSLGQIKVGAFAVDPSINGFRVSGVTATPVMTADSTALSNLFLCPYTGSAISLNDGTNWQLVVPSAEPSIAVTGRTTDLPFDVFAYLSAGAVVLELLNWASATARATGITIVNGVKTKAGDKTRRLVVTVRARSATTFHWVTAGDDLPVKLDLWNADNRKPIGWTLRALTNTWAYTVATWRQAQGSVNYQADIMNGSVEDYIEAQLVASSRNSTISIPRQVGIGVNSTTAFAGLTAATANTVASIESSQEAYIFQQLPLGVSKIVWLEISTATGVCTWVGDDGALRLQSGMNGIWMC